MYENIVDDELTVGYELKIKVSPALLRVLPGDEPSDEDSALQKATHKHIPAEQTTTGYTPKINIESSSIGRKLWCIL